MINSTVLMGRLTAAPELKTTTNGTEVCSFRLAVDRPFTDSSGERQTNFINCVAWRGTAVFISRYFGKGDMIAVTGRIQTRSYEDKDGNRKTVFEVVADQASFTGPKNETSAAAASVPAEDDDGGDDIIFPF